MSGLTPCAATVVARYADGAAAVHLQLQLAAEVRWQAQPGQFFMLNLPVGGEAAFTFVSLPDANGRFSALVRQVGHLTRIVQTLAVGSVVGVRGPFGQPWPLLSAETVLVVAGGCGLAPLAAWLAQRLDSRQHANTVLLYSARNTDSRILARERADWQDAGLPQVLPIDDPAWHTPAELTQATGARLDSALALLPRAPTAALVCGPEAMMLGIGELLQQRGLSAERIWLSLERRMHCGVGLCGHCYLGSRLLCRDGPTLTLAQTRAALAQQVETTPLWMQC